MSSKLPPVPAQQDSAQELWCRSLLMFQSSHVEFERTMEGALAVLPLVPNPLDVIEFKGYGTSSLHQPLSLLMRRHVISGGLKNKHAPQMRVDMDWSADAPWPEGIYALPAPARLALWLMKAGQDPWLPDDNGLDALDWAVQANSRPLVHALLSHPRAPSLEELKDRRAQVWGKSLPWLHFLAHYNALEVMGDLIEAGLDPLQPDSQGWVPLAWASSEETVKFLIKQGVPTESQRKEVSVAWSKRFSKKWHPGEFYPHHLDLALEAVAPLSSQSEDQVAFIRVMETFLRATPAKKHFDFPGRLWGSKDTDALKAWVLENEGQSIQVKSGPARGNWDAWTASLWAAIRVEESGSVGLLSHRQQAFARAFEERMATLPGSEREKWLDASIRPGLSRRGFLTVALGAHRPDLVLPQSMPASSRLALVASSAVSMVGKNPGQDWSSVMASLAGHFMDEVYPSLSFGPDSSAWGGVSEMANAGLRAWTHEQARDILDAAVNLVSSAPASPSPSHLKAFDVAMLYLGCQASDWRGKAVPGSRLKHAQHQAGAWARLATVLRSHDSVFAPPQDYPFHPEAVKVSAGIPRVEAWEAFKEERRLSKAFSQASTPNSRAPRM